jgi:hypothetical protein
MFIVDDLLMKPFVSLLDILQTMALGEMYDAEAIRDDIKENQLLYEIGERRKEEYQQRKQELEAELAMAEQIQSQMPDKMEVKRRCLPTLTTLMIRLVNRPMVHPTTPAACLDNCDPS